MTTQNSIMKFAQAGITGLNSITGGGKSKCGTAKTKKTSKTKKTAKSKKGGTNGGGCCYCC